MSATMGRPPFFTDLESLDKKIEEYFISIKGVYKTTRTLDETGDNYVEITETIHEPEYPSITGLALFLGFADRRSIYDYEKAKPDFTHSLKMARTRVEAAYEQKLNQTACTGSIFALKNFGWADKQEIDHTTKGQAINGRDLSKLSDEEIRIMADIERKLNS